MSWVTQFKKLTKYKVGESTESSRNWRLFESLPVAVPVFVVAAGIVIELLLVMGILHSVLVVLIAFPVGLLAAWYVAPKVPKKLPGTVIERRAVGVALVVGLIAWTGINARLAAETVYIYKDPGVYTNAAKIISEEPDLVVTSSKVFGDNSKIVGDTAGFKSPERDPDRLYVQAPHLMPALVGLMARVAGESAVFAGNVVLGAVGLLTVFGFMRTFIKPRWALLGVWLLGMSLPMVYFSRDVYTEPLAMTFIFATMTLMGMAHMGKQRGLWVVAGMLAAAGLMVRPDTWIPIAGFVAVFMALHLDAKYSFRKFQANLLAFITGAAVSGLVGYLDMINLSYKYYLDLTRRTFPLIMLTILVLALGYTAIFIQKRYNVLEYIDKLTKKWLPLVGAGLIIVLFSVLASRPLWLETTKFKNNGSYVAAVQAANGEEINPNRNYAELTFNWIVWYLGIVAAVAAILALTHVVNKHLKGKAMNILPLTVPFLMMGVFYLIRPSITPDQIWATRRFLPIVFPGIVVFAVLFIQHVYENDRLKKIKIRNLIVPLIFIGMAAGPLWNLRYQALNKEVSGYRLEIDRICGALFEDNAVLMIGTNGQNMTQSVKQYCKVPVERATVLDTEAFKAAREAALEQGYETVVLSVGYEWEKLPPGSGVTIISQITYTELSRTLSTPPTGVAKINRTIHMSRIAESGELIELDIDEIIRRQAEEVK